MEREERTDRTQAAGTIHDLHWQTLEIGREHHARIKNQKPAVVWCTGISGAGKSTLANMIEQQLAALGRHTFLLDGDNLRHGLNRDLGFTDADRAENIRRVSEVVKLLTDAGLIVIAAFISPFRSERQRVRQLLAPGEFFEVFVDTPLAHAEARDVKGLYKKARAGLLKNFTGLDSPYEPPEQPELHVDTTKMTLEQATHLIVTMLETRRSAG